jgi:putative oxidoreductase
MDWVGLLGRVLMSAIFIDSGFGKAMAPSATMALFTKLGLPVVGAAYAVAVIIELGGGILFLVGYRARLTALVLGAWCIITAFTAHYHPGDQMQMINFMKNVCMAGGFLQVVAFGAGRLALSRS